MSGESAESPGAAGKAGYMLDAAGRLVPLANVKPEDLLEDAVVRELDKLAREATAVLEALKARAFREIGALLELLEQKHGARPGGPKGNLTLNSYDGSIRVQVAIGDMLTFGPELQVAKGLIDDCLERWAVGGNENLKLIVCDAFDVGREGKLSVGKILGLRRAAVTDPEWERAMEAISEAIRVVATRRYVRFYRRPAPDKPHAQVPLDLASVAG